MGQAHVQRRISIHAPREGGDVQFHHGLAVHLNISIHAPREGGDGSGQVNGQAYGLISIHAPREGGDSNSAASDNDVTISIHAPREGGDLHTADRFPQQLDFNPRPPRGGRQQRCTVLPADL